MFVQISKIPYRWRTVALLSIGIILCVRFLYSHDFATPPSPAANLLATTYLNQTSNDEMQLTNPIHGFDHFKSRLPKIQTDFDPESMSDRKEREERREAVKEAFLHGWKGYKTYAFGHDELKPISNQIHNPFGGFGATMIDSLSTMLVMELFDEFEQVLPTIHEKNFIVDEDISVFESIIRYLGGLLSAYELSTHPDKINLLHKAEELGLALLPAFDTPHGIPYHKFNTKKNQALNNGTFLADIATVQLEFLTLSYHTNNPVFAERAQTITDFLDKAGYAEGLYLPGLYPNNVDVAEGHFTDTMASFGGMGDSAYEYFLKEYILTEGRIHQYGRMYLNSIDNMKFFMLHQQPGTKFLYLSSFDTKKEELTDTMDHLTCFTPGMLAIGSKIFNRPDDLAVAKGLLETCVFMYRTTATKLAPENWGYMHTVPYNPLTYGKSKDELNNSHKWWNWIEGRKEKPTVMEEKPNTTNRTLDPPVEVPDGLVAFDRRYLLRPETVESLYILYRVTGDPKYQEYGWEIFQAIEKKCKTPSAYASIRNVDNRRHNAANRIDSMESFLFAETFKYLYLLFSSPEVISLDKFVLNTEAHPLLRRP